MEGSTTPSRPCGICNSERKTVINTLLAAGRSANFIEGEMKSLGSPTKAETVTRHLNRCLGGKPPSPTSIPFNGAAKGDFAKAVRDEAMRLLEAGDLKIKANEGLWAQALLDKREEKKADRDLMVNLVRLMAGGIAPPEIIVGEFTDLTDRDDAEPLALRG